MRGAVGIERDEAWTIARILAEEASVLLGQDLLAVYAIGSLADASYRPGRSDIDTSVILARNADRSAKEKVEALRRDFRIRYSLPREIGVVTIRESELYPPYDPARELVPEILRLKRQGVLVRGSFDLWSVPEPAREDFLAYVKVFYAWLRDLIDRGMEGHRTVEAMVNTVLYELRLYIWDRTGEYVFEKPKVIPTAQRLGCRALPREAFQALQAFIVGGESVPLEEAKVWLRAVSRYVRDNVGL